MSEPESTPRWTLASFERYEDAEALVNRLVEEGLPVEGLAIVGRDLVVVEQVVEGWNAARLALIGLTAGGVLGGLFGLLFGLFFTGVPALALFLYWMAVGVGVGLLAAGLVFWFPGRRRKFRAATEVRAGRYEVLADDAVAERVQRVLSGASSEPQSEPQAVQQTS